MSSVSRADEREKEKEKETQRVKVFVRLKPQLEAEGALLPPCVFADDMTTPTTRILLNKPSRHGDASTTKQYTFDGVLNQAATQADVYKEVAQPIVDDVLKGYNGTILAYGQTGAGKTHTLSSIEPASIGIIPRAAQDLFGSVGKEEDCDVEVKLSYLQIYCEQIQDLLKPETGDNLNIREFKDGAGGGVTGRGGKATCASSSRVGVPELQEMVVTCLDDCLRLIQLGDRNRSVAFTALNAHSSRSHAVAIFTVTTRRTRNGYANQKTGRLYLVDLAGSERLKKSKSVAQRAVEARAINLSLTTLGKCVYARATGQMHVPFRDSKLTRLLQESLGGNAKTSMVVAVRVDGDHAEETFQSLEFGARAMHVQTHAEVNVDDVGVATGSPGSLSACSTPHAAQALEKLQRDTEMIQELKKDQERSLKVIESLEKEKQTMLREARALRDAHEEQLGAERSEKDAYRNRALDAERRATDAELVASRNSTKILELREQLDRAMEHIELLEAREDARVQAEREDQARQQREKDCQQLEKLVQLQVEHKLLLNSHSKLEEELASANREVEKYRKRAKEAVFKLAIVTKHHKRVEAKTKAAITIQRAFRKYRENQQRAKIQELARTKDALGNLAAKHAAGERVLGESLVVLHEAVEGILSTFLLKGDRLDAVLKGNAIVKEAKRDVNDLIPAAHGE